MNLDSVLMELSQDPFGDHDVAEIALHLARDEYPRLDVPAYLDQIRDLARDARGHVGGDVAERTLGLCRYLFHQLGYHGNAKEYYDPRNSYLNEVMDRLTGIPITLSLVTIAVGRRLDLPLVGVGLPGHFVVLCESTSPPLLIDPFHGGRTLSIDQAEAMVSRVTGMKAPLSSLELWAAPPGIFVQRMLNNLRGIYLKDDDFRRAAKVLWRLHQVNPSDVQIRRDLGISLLRIDRAGAAIDHLSSYLEAAPDADDAEPIAQLLRSARKAVGRWN